MAFAALGSLILLGACGSETGSGTGGNTASDTGSDTVGVGSSAMDQTGGDGGSGSARTPTTVGAADPAAADYEWATPSSMLTAMLTPIEISQPPGVTIEAVTAFRQTDDFGLKLVSALVDVRSDFVGESVSYVLDDHPVIDLDTSDVPLPGEDFSSWDGPWVVATNPDTADNQSTATVMLSTTGGVNSEPANIPSSAITEPVRAFLANLPGTTVEWSATTWRPHRPEVISVEIELVSGLDERTAVTEWIRVQAVPETYVLAGGRIKATLQGTPAAAIEWWPGDTTDRFRVSFDYALDENGQPRAVSGLGAPPTTTDLIAWGADWHVDEDGTADDEWFSVDFPAHGWDRRPAPFTRGESLQQISSPVNTPGGGMTAWFRHSFELADPATVDQLDLEALVDDGFVVWLNGVELHRWNMVDGPVEPDDYSIDRISGDDELLVRRSVDLDRTVLVPGRNVVAVEVHQATADSADIRFDLRLIAS